VATGPDPAALVRALPGGAPAMPVALVPLADPPSAWRGPLAAAGDAAASIVGPALLVAGAVCGVARRGDGGSASGGRNRAGAEVAVAVAAVDPRGAADCAGQPDEAQVR